MAAPKETPKETGTIVYNIATVHNFVADQSQPQPNFVNQFHGSSRQFTAVHGDIHIHVAPAGSVDELAEVAEEESNGSSRSDCTGTRSGRKAISPWQLQARRFPLPVGVAKGKRAPQGRKSSKKDDQVARDARRSARKKSLGK